MAYTGKPSDEAERLRRFIRPRFSSSARRVLWDGGDSRIDLATAAGDDCAVLDVAGPLTLVAGSDYVRGPKFGLYELGHLSEYDLGYYLVAANMSDVAAMGASPIAFLSVIRYPAELSDEQFEQIIDGIDDACRFVGAANVGGDIGSAERIILSGSALGATARGAALSRGGARTGELVCVTGPTGVAGAAMVYFTLRDERRWALSVADEQELLEAWRRPVARVREGRALVGSRAVSACQDTSDGLLATVEQIAASSSIGVVLNETDIPVPDVVRRVATLAGADPLELAISASVDFHLVFTVAPAGLGAVQEALAGVGCDLVVIGATREGSGVDLRRTGGTVGPAHGFTWAHRGDYTADVLESIPARREQEPP